MNRSLRLLEFDQIRTRLASYCDFSASADLAQELTPAADLETVRRKLAETTEARALLDQHSQLGVGGARDVRPHVLAARKGAVVQPVDLLELQTTLLSARSLRRTLLRLALTFPRLALIAGSLVELPQLVEAIGQTVNDRGEILDSASPELARIRRELNVLRGRLMERLQRYLASQEYARLIQEPIITQRDGRYVIPVRAEARGRVNGIVHDTSASGATLFVEPLAVVNLGNDIRELQARETREIDRILRELAARIAAEGESIEHTVEALAELDLALAKGKYSETLKAVAPRMGESKEGARFPLALIEARHPLLDPEKVVPTTVRLGETYSILVITGPNTGGKTVTLKTAGLLATMAQSGMHIPAQEGSQLPVFTGVFADIGDEQSIEQSLSTFSSHLSNIIEILRSADARSLVLLDELGAGTDPIEGAALGRAVLEHLLRRRILTMVATHYAELKAFAHTTPEVENASMEFDLETLAPTYRLQTGLPGRSNAFAIAARLGLDPEIIRKARSMMTQSDVEFETMLAEIRKAKEETARELRRTEQAHAQAQKAADDMRQRQAQTERERRDILAQAQREAEAELEATRAELRALKREWRQVALTRDFVERAEARLEAVAEEVEARPGPGGRVVEPEPTDKSRRVAVGDRVWVTSIGAEGEVVGVGDGQVDVQLGALRAHLPLEQVELRSKQIGPAVVKPGTVVLPVAESPGVEVHLRGMRAEEALEKLDKYLDRAYLAGLPYVRIVHGKGTGTLRRLVRERLNGHPLVREVRNAEANEGAEGVTIAMLVSG